MPITRSSITGGPAHINYAGVNYHTIEDAKLSITPTWEPINSSMFGDIEDIATDFVIKATGTPLEFTSTNIAPLFPAAYGITLAAPSGSVGYKVGSRLFPDTDVPLIYWANNGDIFTIKSAAVTKPPSLALGVNKPILGSVEWTGVIPNGATAGSGITGGLPSGNSYYTYANSTYVPVAVTKSNIKRQTFLASWGSRAGFTSFQAQDGWTVDWEIKLEPVLIQTRTIDFKIQSVRAMAKCTPVGPSWTEANNQVMAQRESGYRMSAAKDDLVITGSLGTVVTIYNAALKEQGFEFSGKKLRHGEFGFVSTIDVDVTNGITPIATIIA